MQIQPEQLGKRVLDIGSGLHELFSKSAAFYGIKVDSLNPKLKFKKVRKHLDDCTCLSDEPVLPWQRRSIAGLVLNLPVRSSIYDSVVSLFAFPYYFRMEELLPGIEELLRVVKPGGNIYLSPVKLDMMEYFLGISDLLSVPVEFKGLNREELWLAPYLKQAVKISKPADYKDLI